MNTAVPAGARTASSRMDRSGRVDVKICGLTRRADAVAAVGFGADYLGTVLVPDSPRALIADTARKVVGGLDKMPILLLALEDFLLRSNELSVAFLDAPFQTVVAFPKFILRSMTLFDLLRQSFSFLPEEFAIVNCPDRE